MAWTCKLCAAAFDKRTYVLEHYRLHHSSVSSVSPLPCVHDDGVSTFQTVNALKIHLSRIHTQMEHDVNPMERVSFICPKCGFKQPFNGKTILSHLRAHLKQHEMVDCPYKDCHYCSNVYTSFNAHKSRHHPDADAHLSNFKNDIILTETDSPTMLGQVEAADFPQSPPEHESPDYIPLESTYDTCELQAQLKSNLSSLFLKMHSILHVSETAIQDIVENLGQIFLLSKPLVKDSILTVLQEHEQSISDVLLNDLVEAIMKSNVFVSATAEGAELSTSKRRKTFVRSNYPLVMPVQYTVGLRECTVVYVPVLQMLQAMFKNTDLNEKIQGNPSSPGMYMSHEDGTYFKENQFLAEAGELKLSLILYMDDLEIANPLGTSRKIHKLCAVYWLLANLPSKYRSSLHVIQLALLCKVSDVQRCGYESILSPLLKDLQTLEQDGIFIETLGQRVQGTVLCVAADNLAAHGLAGFVQSFRGQYVCRFCCCTTDQIQISEVSKGEFSMRKKETHDLHVQKVVQEENVAHLGVVGECPLSKALQHFHTVTGFPPDILHDLFEGVVPVELALCIRELIRQKYFTFEYLNTKIRTFPYQHFDKIDKPQPIPKSFVAKLSIGGNGHENSALLRLLPLMIGSKVPEGNETWDIIMNLKEIVQLVLSPSFTEESLQYLQTKISDHRQALKAVFPEFNLRPKHHYIEHYPELIKRFGPLVHLWTMRFEGKHRFFKRVMHDTQNFKNVLKTLADRHQSMMAFHMNAPSFFKPQIQTRSVTSVQVTTLPQVAADFIKTKTDSQNIYSTSVVSIDGTDYANGMFVSAGQSGGLPNFCKIERILLVNNSVSFLCRSYECWYIEHLRSFKLTSLDNFSVHELSELNDTNFFLHVHTSTDIVRKMTLSSRPASVEELKTKIKEKFDLTIDFTLSYQDPDFNGQLCSLLDIEELPQKAVLIVVRSENDASSVASDDTVILPHARIPERTEMWPCIFQVPTFSFEVELVLAEGNAAYETTGKTLKLNRGQKHNILETLAEQMHGYKAYPNVKEISMVAEALVNKHPCLKEPGSFAGWYGWKNSLTFKMGNYRTKLSRAGSQEVAVNSGKRSKNYPQKDATHTNIKRPKRAEINFLPNFPRGEDASSLEQQRQRIIDEVQMADKNLVLITKLMDSTFALRRKEIVCNEIPVDEILKRWPALKLESQICAEFHRVTNVNLKNRFFAQLDQHTPRLQSLFRKKASRTGKASELLDELFRIYDLQDQVDVHVRRAVVLRALPPYMHESDVSFFKMWDVEQTEELNTSDVPLGLLLSNQTSSDAHFFCPERIAVLIEGNIVIESSTLADAFVILFALTYTLHLNYPKQLLNTFDFVQKVLMGLEDGKLRPRVLSLKNDLLAVV